MPQAHLDDAVPSLAIGRRQTLDEIEVLLGGLNATTAEGGAHRQVLKLAAQTRGDVLADVWRAITVGTICRRARGGTRVITWGSPSWQPDVQRSVFAQSLAGLVAVQMAAEVVTDGKHLPVDGEQVERVVSLKHHGVLELAGGATRTLVEFDPQQPLALALQDRHGRGGDIEDQRRLFGQLLLRFRSELEIGNISRGIPHVEVGAIKTLGKFLGELHDNAYEHGRVIADYEQAPRNIRFLRLRRHVAKNRQELLSRAQSVAPLHHYLEHTVVGSGPQAVMEAMISDFGLGIVDHFLRSPQGRFYRDEDRRHLLDQLLMDTLSAKDSDPAAGDGIQHALKAAKEMSGFVSLRTGEFWLTQSYADPAAVLALVDVENGRRARVAGTHWQILWPLPL